MSKYTKTIDDIAENLAALHLPTPDESGAYYADRIKERQAEYLLEIDKIKQLNLSRDQLIDKCAFLQVQVKFEQNKFADFKHIVDSLIYPALIAAAPMADGKSKTQIRLIA